VDRYHWLLVFHMAGAFLLLGGAVFAGVLNLAALRRERPSEIAVLYRLVRIAVASVSAGMVLTIVFGLWLVADLGRVKWSTTWVILALVGWVLANALGSAGGRREKETRLLAERLAAEGDAPSTDLHARMRDPLTLALSWGSGAVVIAILALMIWKPGHSVLGMLRPDNWNFPLFLHVLGAMTLTGATAAAFVAAVSEPRWPWLRMVVARTMLLAVFPAWLLMRLAGQWIDSKEDIAGDPGWLSVGFIVGDAGLVLLIVAMILAAVGVRRPQRNWPIRVVAGITGLYFVALIVAMFAMTGKPGA
jgi:uncharacterized membrane protein